MIPRKPSVIRTTGHMAIIEKALDRKYSVKKIGPVVLSKKRLRPKTGLQRSSYLLNEKRYSMV